MKTLINTVAALMIAGLPILAAAQPADAGRGTGRGTVIRIGYEGFHLCKSYREEGTASWAAVANGLLNDGGGFRSASSRYFSVRTCFTSEAACENWLDRIHHTIYGIDELRRAECKRNA